MTTEERARQMVDVFYSELTRQHSPIVRLRFDNLMPEYRNAWLAVAEQAEQREAEAKDVAIDGRAI